MFSWLGTDDRRRKDPEVFQTVSEGLKKLYKSKLLPLEEYYRFHEFHSPALEDADFDNKPMVLLVGQYSTGKTTFIRYLLEQDFPGMRIGPEPTTDSFIAVMQGDTEGIIPGNALVVDPKKPFRKLNVFGNAFLNRFVCAQLPNAVLESISVIDTPGILSGEKQRISRGYDFAAVLEWFAERVDRIILLFDAHKLDISDEFSEVIKALKNHEDKMRVVLNKADQIETQQLMRVYGALMWSLGKIVNTPEVIRVYIGSFWSHPLLIPDNRKLFEAEEQDLFRDIQSLPRNAALRKLNDLIKRARLAKVHAYIISSLKKEMPSVFGKDNKKKELVNNLAEIYGRIEREHQISPGDFPNLKRMQVTKLRGSKPRDHMSWWWSMEELPSELQGDSSQNQRQGGGPRPVLTAAATAQQVECEREFYIDTHKRLKKMSLELHEHGHETGKGSYDSVDTRPVPSSCREGTVGDLRFLLRLKL
ncbi:Hypothetical predicted protein [Marmota monax]|uniref:Dynamin-type G domain-containing protein n=1 Tax=Marmota monax TaxID=9995 RepID=A0A5E4BUG3_MARMO|nr:Hypothetical predicted protein [Marmota monax]VTJ73254.1 Hypothetical predicted protein [Marmota monax]